MFFMEKHSSSWYNIFSFEKVVSTSVQKAHARRAIFQMNEEDISMDKKEHKILKFFAVVGLIAAIAGVAYAIYRFFTPDYLEDFEDDFDDDFDDYFEDEDEEEEKKSTADTVKETASKVAEKVGDVAEDVKEKVGGAVDSVKAKVSATE